jgi:predicted Rossmann-fold nucleotide-binding protein
VPRAPLILVGESFWKPLEGFFKEALLKEGAISQEDLSIYTITDSEDEIINIIKNAPVRLGIQFNRDSENPCLANGKPQKADRSITQLLKKRFF